MSRFSRWWFNDSTEGTKVSVFNIGDSFDINKSQAAIKDAYSSNGDVHAIIKKIADNAKKIPRELWKSNGGEFEQVTEGDLWEIVTKQPNEKQNIHDFIEASVSNLLLTGNSFRRGRGAIGFQKGLIFEILPVNNHIVTVECMFEDFNYVPKGYKLIIDNKVLLVDPKDMNHTKLFNPTVSGMVNCMGLSPLQAGLLSLVANNANKTAQSVIVTNQGIRGMITSRSDRGQSDEERKQIQEAADMRMMGAKKFGKAIATSANVDWIQMGMDPTQLKILESAVLTLRDLCNLYGVDSSLFNDPANQTYNNRKEAEKAMYSNAVVPINTKDIESLSSWLLPAWNEAHSTTYEIRQDLSVIPVLHTDENEKAKRSKNISTAIIPILASELLTRDQKIQSLVETLQISVERAEVIVGNGA